MLTSSTKDTAMTLNRDPLQYRDLGYCVADHLIDADELRAARASLDQQIATLPPGRRPEALVEPHMLAEDWLLWLKLCCNPRVLDAVQACLQCDELILLMSHLIVKPAHNGQVIAWHQDNTYWSSVTGTDVTTVWLALDDVDRANACMRVIPSTHAGYPELEMIRTDGEDLLNVRVAVTPEVEARAVDIVLPAGSASLHDSFVIHGSQANISARRRAGYTMRYANAATVSVDVARHGKPVYYVRGNGRHCQDDFRDQRPGMPWPSDNGTPQHRIRGPQLQPQG
jgi:phytanoyl-CoA hydroxylase